MKQRRQKLVDAWTPTLSAGPAIGCISTTFTFDSVFFEEECLARFLSIESDPNQDGPIYLIEREEKLANVCCAAALVDQHYARGSRSIRWDIIPARVPAAIMHAKLSLLCWSSLIRLIVSSANLTEDGYRRNQEVAAVVDFGSHSEVTAALLDTVHEFLEYILTFCTGGKTPGEGVSRCLSFIDKTRSLSQYWNSAAGSHTSNGSKPKLITTGPGKPSVLRTLREYWKPSAPPSDAHVVSPFFDKIENHTLYTPALETWELLRKRGEASLHFHVTGEESDEEEKRILHVPESLMKSTPDTSRKLAVQFYEISETPALDGRQGPYRPLHAKGIWLENDDHVAYMIGSSNFTTAGLGLELSARKNIEANILYQCSVSRQKPLYKAIRDGFPDSSLVDSSMIRGYRQIEDTEETEPIQSVLPLFFDRFVFFVDERRDPKLSMNLNVSHWNDSLSGWAVYLPGETSPCFTEAMWRERETLESMACTLQLTAPPSECRIRWNESAVSAPIISKSQADLPPPDDLRNLSLQVLLDILSSARPPHQVIRRWIQRKEEHNTAPGTPPQFDPLRRFDDSGTILRRTRRVSWALENLRCRLERPLATIEQLYWRLRGPIGVLSLAQAIARDTRNDEELSFL